MQDKKPANKTRKRFTSKSIRLEPKQTKQLALGSYSFSEPMPQFDLTTEPELGEYLGASLEQEVITGTPRYVLFYHLHNFGSTPCQVTAERREDDSDY